MQESVLHTACRRVHRSAAKLSVSVQALTSVIELPHSPLIKYTATDTTDNSAAFKQAVAYKKLDYKVHQPTATFA